MSGKTANDFIHTNAEYEKLKKKGVGGDGTPRETPAGQAPGRRGFDKQLFADWTFEELIAYAHGLGIDHGFNDNAVSSESKRKDLIDAIEARDATSSR